MLRYGCLYNKFCNGELPPLKRGDVPKGRGTGFAKLPVPLMTDVKLGPNIYGCDDIATLAIAELLMEVEIAGHGLEEWLISCRLKLSGGILLRLLGILSWSDDQSKL